MKIKVLDIYGYGKWVDQRFEIADTLQIIYGPNEIGKSTLQSFIKSILFGFPDKRKRKIQQNRFEPRNGSTYGGRLLVTDTDFGDVWIERTSKFLSIRTVEGEILPETTVKKILGGMDETLFDYFYGFNLQNLQELANVGSEDLNDFFLSIGTLGSDQFLNAAQQFQKETDELFKNRGTNPKLNQALAEYAADANRLEQLKGKNQRYDQLVSQSQAENAAVDQLNQTITQLEESLRHLDKLMNRYEIYLKDLVIQRRIDHLVFTPMEAAMPETLNQTIRDNHESEKKIVELKERIRHIEQDFTQLTALTWAKNHQQMRDQWKVTTEEIKQIQTQVEQVQRNIQESENLMAHLAEQGRFYPDKIVTGQEYDRMIDKGLSIQGEKESLKDTAQQIESERKILLDQRKGLQNNSSIMRQQIAVLENQRVNDEEQLIQMTRLSHYLMGGIFTLAGVGMLISQLSQGKALTDLFSMGAVVLIIIGCVWMGYVFMRHRSLVDDYKTNPLHAKIADLHEKEAYYLQESKELSVNINEREMSLTKLKAKQADLLQQQQEWVVSLGFYPSADPEIIIKTNPIHNYLDAKDRYQRLQAEESQLRGQIDRWKEAVQPLLDRFPKANIDIRGLIRHVEETEAMLIQMLQRAQALDERKQGAMAEIEVQEGQITQGDETIQSILDHTQSKDIIDFNRKVQINEEIKRLKEKHQMYFEQIEADLEQLTQIEHKQELTDLYTSQEQALARAKENLRPHNYQLANLMVEIKQLEEDGTYAEVTQSMEHKKAQISQMIMEWGQKRIATELIYDTLRHGMENPLPEMNDRVNEIFTKLSNGRYTKVIFNKKGIKVRQFSDIMFEPHELSQGTLEQLYVALRLAFVESAKQMVAMPLMIDDAFVNFDEQRRISMYEVLKEMAHRHQILFFTFDQLAIELFKEAHEMDLAAISNNANREEE